MLKDSMLKILFIFGIVFLSLIGGVFALVPNNNLVYYYPLANDANDYSGNSYNATNNGVTFNGSEANFTSGDYLQGVDLTGTIDYQNEVINLWFKGSSAQSSTERLWVDNVDGDTWAGFGSTDNLLTRVKSGTNSNDAGYRDDTWHMVTMVMYTSTYSLYIDGNFSANYTIGVAGTGEQQIFGAFNDLAQQFFIGEMKLVSYWNTTLSASDVLDIYINGVQISGVKTISFTNITVNGQTFLNNSYFNTSILNFTTILETQNTNNNTNQTFFLYNATDDLINTTQYATNNLTGNFILNLTDGQYHIYFFAENNETNVTSITYFFIDDKNPPNITLLTNQTEFNTFSINFSNIFNVTDSLSGIASCTINITELENVTTADNFFINCTDTQIFNSSGLHNAYVLASDNSGNTATYSWNFTVNPEIYAFFNDTENATLILNYTATIFHPDGRQTTPTVNPDGSILLNPINNGSLDLGLHTIQFEKFGYVTQNFTLNITETSNFNVTYNVSSTKIYVNIYDRQTGELLNATVDINILTVGNQTTSNGTTVFQTTSLTAGSYHIQAVSAGFYTEEQDFTYSGESNSIINFYLLNSTFSGSTTLVVPVIDEFFNIIEGSDTRLLEYDNDILGFKQVSSCKTNSNGECTFLVEINTKKYIITTSKTINNIVFSDQSSQEGEFFKVDISGGAEIPDQIILNNLVLKFTSQLTSPSSLGLRISVPENTSDTIVSENATNTVINIPVNFVADNGLSYTVCLEMYRTDGTNFFNTISPICLTGASGILPVSNINLNNDFDYQARVTITYDGVKSIYKTYYYNNKNSFIEILLQDNLASSFILLFWVALLAASLYIRSLAIWAYGSWTLSIVQFSLFTGYLVGSASVIIILINIGVLYISKRQGDTL